MTLQLLCRFDVTDQAQWKDAFAADHEDQRNAGLSLLQLWQSADDPQRIFALFQVNDRAKAQGWIDRAQADVMGRRAGVTASDAQFVRTM